ncbi:hypothetical protein BGW37DRAFT_231126 [Umbelopsis sp. PMI_123]|nr:hypothetical protein BGW37DRAFT_231126 [Umbelopsis sp. PMI_123]
MDVGSLKNAWDIPMIIKESDNHDDRTTVNPLPPLPEITVADQPWYLEEAHVQEYQAAQAREDEHVYDHPKDHGIFEHQPPPEPQYEESQHYQQSEPAYKDVQHIDHHQEDHNVPEIQEPYERGEQLVPQQEPQTNEPVYEPEPAQPIVQEREYPMMNWNPSWEEPPTNINDIDFPDLHVYSNVWDNPQPNTEVWVPPTIEELPPPPTMIDYHHQYVHHHEEVHEEHPQEATPYVPLFPWEEKKEHRPLPSRIWQDELELDRRAREEAERLRAEEDARIKAEEEAEWLRAEAQWRKEEERRGFESEQSTEQQRHESSYSSSQWLQENNLGQVSGVNNQQEIIQQALDAEADIIEQTVSETQDQPQPSTIDQPFVSVWDQMPSITRYLQMLGANDTFRKSEYQLYQNQEEEEKEAIYSQQEQELTTDEDDEEEYESDEEEEEEEEEGDDDEEAHDDTVVKSTVSPAKSSSWWGGEPFAIDSMPTTPKIGKFGWRSPLMPTTPRLEDDDWDDRDLIPLPLKRTSSFYQSETLYQQESASPPKPTASIPKSNASASDSEASVKQQKKKRRVKKPRKLFADEDDMLKRTPFASAVTTPTSEKSFSLPNVEVEDHNVVIDNKESESFGEYKIQWASDLLKGSQASVISPMVRSPAREKEATSYFEGSASPATPKKNKYNILASRTAWDPLRALKSLKANGERLLITTKLGGAEQGNQKEDVDVSDDEYAPAAYYDNDDEEDLGVLGLTFPTSKPTQGYAMSKEDSPRSDSMSASPATPTAKGMAMNLTDKIIQEVAERRASTELALHEAATSLVKSTEADDDRYAMSPVFEELPGKNVSATELEIQGDLFKRRASLESLNKDTPTTESAAEIWDEKPPSKQTSVNVDPMRSDTESLPVQYDIVQAATEKLKQIAGIDWEAAAKEESSRDDDISNWVFAQQYEVIPSAQQTIVHKQTKASSIDDMDIPSVPAESVSEELAIAEEQIEHHGEDIKKEQQKEMATPVVIEAAQVTAHDDVPVEAEKSTLPSDLPEPKTSSDEPAISNISVVESKSATRKTPGHLTLKENDDKDIMKDDHTYDDLKTPTQATFISDIHPGQDTEIEISTPEYAPGAEQSLPEHAEKKLIHTVEHLVRQVEADEPTLSEPVQGTHDTPLMEHEASLSNRDAQALSDEEITSYIQCPTINPASAHISSTDLITGQLAQTEDTDRDDDELSDTQYLSATEGDHQSESGTSVDWFSVQSSNVSDDSDNDDDQRVPQTANIHQEFLRRFGQFPQLNNEITSLEILAPHEDIAREEDNLNHPESMAADEEGSVTPDDSSDHTQ